MILFVTGQYAGAQYLHPLLEQWEGKTSPEWELVATGPSCDYWDECGIPYTIMEDGSSVAVAAHLELRKPSLVMVSTSAYIELEYTFIIEAKKKLVPSACFIDTWVNYRARFQHQGKLIFSDYVLAIDDRCAEESVAEGVPEKIIRVIGQPYLEKVASNIPTLGCNTLLVSQPLSSRNRWKNLGYDETDFLKVCLKAVDILKMDSVYATRHPTEEVNVHLPDSSRLTWKDRQGEKDVVSSHTLLGMFSTQMVIGYLWGRKVASIQPGLSMGDPSPLSRWGLIPRLEKVDEIVEFINETDASVCDIDFKNNLFGSLDRLESFCIGEAK